jgi:hypothetical protein
MDNIYNPYNIMNQDIQRILNQNKLDDLDHFIKRRHFLNRCNSGMIYMFYIIQSFGILATSYSASTNDQQFLWVGIGMNMLASIIQVYEKINNDQMKKLFLDIQSIQNNTYLDESPYMEMEPLKQIEV